MTLLRAIRLDLKVGLRGILPVLAGISVVSISCLIVAYTHMDAVGAVDVAELTFADNFALVFAGSLPFEYRPGILFVPPLGWTFLSMLVLYASLSYPYRDLMGFGQQVLVRENSRVTWLLSKCVWVLLTCMLGCMAIALTVALWTLAHGQQFNVLLHSDSLYLAAMLTGPFEADVLDGTGFLLGIIVTLCSLSLLQLFLGIILRPSISFLSMVLLLISSAYAQTWYLPGNYLMFVRWGGFVEGGVDTWVAMMLSLGIALVSFAAGLAYFCKMDLIDRETSA
ncbi:MAG: hypothetical protein Q4B77_03685 [Coriobacteriaceae bacterium]|nr:hypothetical protein [Coriobacteriaceae bacterium]